MVWACAKVGAKAGAKALAASASLSKVRRGLGKSVIRTSGEKGRASRAGPERSGQADRSKGRAANFAGDGQTSVHRPGPSTIPDSGGF